MPRKCANGACKKVAILKRPKTDPDVLPEESGVRNPYVQYPQESLEKAINAVREKKMSCCKASKVFAVPRSTLKNYLQDRSKLGVKAGRRRSIPEDIENDLIDKAISAAEAGFPITKKEFLLKVELTAKKLKLQTPFTNGVPGNDYWRGVKTRRPDIVTAIRKSDNKNINMKKDLKDDIVDNYFDQLEKLLTELDIFVKPACIWNAGEVGIQYCAEPVKLISKRGTRNITSKPGINVETMNAVLSVNAFGAAMPPMFVVARDKEKIIQKYTVQTSPQASVWTEEEKSWKGDDDIMVEWFKEVFMKTCGPDRPQLLMMDNHGSQEMLEMLNIAQKERIHVLSFPPRTTPWLEPLDRGIFMNFQKCCRKCALQFMLDNPTLTINRETWKKVLCMVWDEVMTVDVISRAFEVTGIYPLNRGKIAQHAKSSINKAHDETLTATTILEKTSSLKYKDLSATARNTATSSQQITSHCTSNSNNQTTHTSYSYGDYINPDPSFQTLYQPNPPLPPSHHPSTPSTANNNTSSLTNRSFIYVKPTASIHHNLQGAASTSSVPTPASAINEGSTASVQVYTPVSTHTFMPSTDQTSMFPVFNT